jgi:hypothetical protein
MIRFALRCDSDHAFDGWFASNDAFEQQKKRGLLDCPACGSAKVEKSLMSPNVVTADKRPAPHVEAHVAEGRVARPAPEPGVGLALDPERAEMMQALREMAKAVRDNADNVGKDFAEEARRIHFGEAKPRGIYGEASHDEVKGLIEDGVPVAPMPVLPEDRN